MTSPRFLSAWGTFFPSWFIGRGASGIKLKAVDGMLQVRNAADTEFVGIQSGDIDQLPGINARVASYTLVLADADKIIEMGAAGAQTLTVPPNVTVAFPIGTSISVVQSGAGALTFVAGAGVTINSAKTLVAARQYAEMFLYKTATNVWTLSGDLIPTQATLTQTYATADATHAARTAAVLASLSDARHETFSNILAATTTAKITTYDLSLGVGVATGIVQPDVPRNVVLTITDGDASISAFVIDLVGIGVDGTAITEQFLFAGGLVQTGSKMFMSLTSLTITSIVGHGAADALNMGYGVKIGVTIPRDSTGLTIRKIVMDGTVEAASATDATNNSFTSTTAPNGAHDFDVWYSFLNTSRDQVNKAINDALDTAQLLNSLIDALQVNKETGIA